MMRYILSIAFTLVLALPCLAGGLTKADFNLGETVVITEDPRDRLLNKVLDRLDALERKMDSVCSPQVQQSQCVTQTQQAAPAEYIPQQQVYYYQQPAQQWYWQQPVRQSFSGWAGGGGNCGGGG